MHWLLERKLISLCPAMISRCKLHDDILYESVLDHHDVKRLRLERVRAFSLTLVLCSVVLVVTLCFFGLPSERTVVEEVLTSQGDQHTIPTPLSVVDPDTGRYLYALDVPLYDLLKGAATRRAPSLRIAHLEAPQLILDRLETSIRQPLTLSWTLGQDVHGKPLIKDDDILSLHCPHVDPHCVFQEAATLAQVRTTSQRHGGHDEHSWYFPDFPVLRHETCQFRLFQSLPDNQVQLLAESPVLTIRDSPRTPSGVHLAFSNDTTQMVVQFVTGEEGTPVAMYGIDKTTIKVEGSSHTYSASDLCQEPANVTETGKFQAPGMMHVVTLVDLKLDTDYLYKVGLASGQGIVWSDTFQFHSAPAVGDTKEFSYVVYGDQGCPSVGWGDGGTWTAAMAARESSIRAVHHFGDLSYARGAAHIWDEWFHMIQSFAAKVPLMIGVGNHEYDHVAGGENGKDPSGLNSSHGFMPEWGNFGDDSGGECGVPTARRFVMPASNGSNGIFWYSHDYALVHTTVISSEHNLTKGSPQYQWLEEDLSAVNRTRTPWLVVESHRPMYESESSFDQTAVGVAMRYEFEELLHKHKVDVFLAGHHHQYQRTCDGLYRSKCYSGGPVHITIGSAGAALDNATIYPQTWTSHVVQGEYGYGRITVSNASAMHWEFVKAGAENDTDAGSVQDDMWIFRSR